MAEREPFQNPDYLRLRDWSLSRNGAGVLYHREIAAPTDGPILDVACTTGRLDIELARDGHEVVGLVCSEAAHERVLQKLSAEPIDVRDRVSFVQAEMESFDLGRQFAAVFMPECAVSSLEGPFSISQCFKRMYRHTRPGGLAVVDTVAPNRMADQEIGRTVDVGEGVNGETGLLTRERMRVTNIWWDTHVVSVLHSYTEVDGDGEREFEFQLDYRWLDSSQAIELLHRAGYPEVDAAGDYSGVPFGPESPRLILRARRLERDFI